MLEENALDEILSCQTLPSLPAVALRVIDLTSDANVSLSELASVIATDQALASKILRTINSSFYGLRKPCASIDRALVMLGLSPVKSLALGFSLVSAVGEGDENTPFDYVSYWRRGLYSAVSAKIVAEAAGIDEADEAFLGGLLQDIGMVAMYQALGVKYLKVLHEAGTHDQLVKCELEHLDLQHPAIGAILAKRWKLPDELVLPIKYHERPSASPPACVGIVRSVGLGNIVHDVLTESDATPALRRLYQRADQWFKLDTETCDGIVQRAGESANEMASLFSLDVGEYTNADAVLNAAREKLVESSAESAQESPALLGMDGIVQEEGRDAATGVINRDAFTEALRVMFGTAVEREEPVSVVAIAIEGLASLDPERVDKAALAVSALARMQFEPSGGVVGRLSPAMFAVSMIGLPTGQTVKECEAFRVETERSAEAWAREFGPGIRVSIGAAARDKDNPVNSPQELVAASAKAVIAARDAGGNCVRVYAERKAA